MEINEVIKIAEEKGIDVLDLITTAISRVDPPESIKLRMALAERFMAEAEEYLRKGDAVQASEKAYKAAEEVVKALAEKYGLPEYRQALGEGRWFTYLLTKAVNYLAEKLGNWVRDGWSSAYLLHVWGFHEAKLSVDDISHYIDAVRAMVSEAKRILAVA